MVIFGTLGIQNGLTEWEPLFQGIPGFALTVLPIERNSEHLAIAHIRLVSERDQSEFCRLAGFTDASLGVTKQHESGGIVRVVKRMNDKEVIYIESSISFPDRDAYFRLIDQ